jgi:hypothetical protein
LREVEVLPELEAKALLDLAPDELEEAADDQAEEGEVVSVAFADGNVMGPREFRRTSS